MQLAGGVTADQLKPMAVEEDAVAVSPVGTDGTLVQDVLAKVVACACADAADVPSESTAFTT